ncbi:MAG: hypothetical protein R2806_02905 [Saprospiraceae bacterium]
MIESFTTVAGEKIEINVSQIQAYWQSHNFFPPVSVIAITDLDSPSGPLQSIQIKDPYQEIKFRIERHR